MKPLRIVGALLLALAASGPGLANDISNTSWSETAASNTAAPPNGWPSGTVTPVQVSPMMRETMAAIKRWYNHANAVKTSAGSANVQTLTYDVAPAAYVTGDGYTFIVGAGLTNTGVTSLNVNGLGAKAVQIGSIPLAGGELIAGRAVSVYYDGTVFQLSGGGVVPATASTAGSAKLHNVPIAVGWPATLNPNNIVLAVINQNSTISALIGSVEVATGGAATVSVYKAPSGTACSAGTILHSGSFNANGTAATNQTLTLTVTTIAAGDRICLQTTGTTSWTTGVGVGTITVFLAPTA